jgi:hypothetical protein
MDGWVLSQSTFLSSQVGSWFFQHDVKKVWENEHPDFSQIFNVEKNHNVVNFYFIFRLSYIRLLPLGCSIILVLSSGWNQTGRSGTKDFLWLLYRSGSSGRNQTGQSVTKDFKWLLYQFSLVPPVETKPVRVVLRTFCGCSIGLVPRVVTQKLAEVVLRTFVMKQAVGGSLSQFFAFCPWPLSTSLTTASEPAIPTKHM